LKNALTSMAVLQIGDSLVHQVLMAVRVALREGGGCDEAGHARIAVRAVPEPRPSHLKRIGGGIDRSAGGRRRTARGVEEMAVAIEIHHAAQER
jgi:hypothetical protein